MNLRFWRKRKPVDDGWKFGKWIIEGQPDHEPMTYTRLLTLSDEEYHEWYVRQFPPSDLPSL